MSNEPANPTEAPSCASVETGKKSAKTYIDRLTKDQIEVGVCEGKEDSSGEAKKNA